MENDYRIVIAKQFGLDGTIHIDEKVFDKAASAEIFNWKSFHILRGEVTHTIYYTKNRHYIIGESYRALKGPIEEKFYASSKSEVKEIMREKSLPDFVKFFGEELL